MDPSRASWLCRDDIGRERLLDMERRLRPMRAATFVVLGAALVASVPWLGWWPLLPMTVAVCSFAVAGRLVDRVVHPEYAAAGAWVVAQVTIAISIALSGGARSPALGWLAIPVVTLSARFDRRGVAAGLMLTTILMLAVTVGAGSADVSADPSLAFAPLALIAAVALLSTALMSSDVEHRSKSVLDDLTGMLNRASLSARVAELRQQAELTREPVGVVVGDIDHFKPINDEHGHAVGDAVLVGVAAAMRTQLRAFDLAYRIGGEEFLVLLPGARLADAAELAERLRAAIEATPAAGGLQVTMSFGVTCSNAGEFDFPEVFAAADEALYAAKRAGRNRVHLTGDLQALGLAV